MTELADVSARWGFPFPKELLDVWKAAKTLNAKNPLDALYNTIGVTLEGPFLMLAGKKPPQALGRWRADPPEFFTIASGDTDGLHWGYVVHDPGNSTPVCAHFYSRDGSCMAFDGSFASALLDRLEETRDTLEDERDDLEGADEGLDQRIARVRTQLEVFSKLTSRAALRKSPKPIGTTLDGLGIVCSPSQFTGPGVSDEVLRKELRDPRKRARHLENARAMLPETPGGALKIARDLYAIAKGEDVSQAVELLTSAYDVLKRPVLAQAIAALFTKPRPPRAARRDAMTAKKTTKRIDATAVGSPKPKKSKPIHAITLEEALVDPGAVQSLTLDYFRGAKKFPTVDQWRAMTRLTSLRLLGGSQKEIPIDGAQLTNLELYEHRLPTFPSNWRSMPKLTSLTLIKIGVPIPDTLAIPNAFHVAIARMNLRRVPKFVLCAKNLSMLILSNNRIDELPRGLAGLSKLEYMDLQSNALTDLPDIWERFPELTTLSLAKNKLKHVPKSFAALRKRLKSLDLAENPIAKDKAQRDRIKALLPKTEIRWL